MDGFSRPVYRLLGVWVVLVNVLAVGCGVFPSETGLRLVTSRCWVRLVTNHDGVLGSRLPDCPPGVPAADDPAEPSETGGLGLTPAWTPSRAKRCGT